MKSCFCVTIFDFLNRTGPKILAQKTSSKLFVQHFPGGQFNFCHLITFIFDCETKNQWSHWKNTISNDFVWLWV
jgi:hypothetical protein